MMASSMVAARAIHCELQPPKTAASDSRRVGPAAVESYGPDQVKILLQPRMCTLRSYASDRSEVIRTMTRTSSKEGDDELSPFLANLYEYIESSKKSHDFEIITGRLAMIVFAATMGAELATGDSVFKKMDVQGIAEALGACFAAVTCAAAFAYSSSARNKVGKIFTVSCNAFIDALIDNIIDGLFYDDENENDLKDQSNNDL